MTHLQASPQEDRLPAALHSLLTKAAPLDIIFLSPGSCLATPANDKLSNHNHQRDKSPLRVDQPLVKKIKMKSLYCYPHNHKVIFLPLI